MIHYHGTPITPNRLLFSLKGRHFFISFWRTDNIDIVSEIAQSFAIDNGAFSAWTKGVKPDWERYKDFIYKWQNHPGYDWHIIPDIIDGSEMENDKMIESWNMKRSVPVWHLHESLDRLKNLVNSFDRIALGSSGEYSTIASDGWWEVISKAMSIICDDNGFPKVRVHGLRMLDNKLRRIPFASADSTNVAQNSYEKNGMSAEARTFFLADKIESEQSSSRWVEKKKEYETDWLLN